MSQALASTILAFAFVSSLVFLGSQTESFGNEPSFRRRNIQNTGTPTPSMGYPPTSRGGVGSNVPFQGPDLYMPVKDTNVSLASSGAQSIDYQLFQQAVNAATPTMAQLDSVSGQPYQQSNHDSVAQKNLTGNSSSLQGNSELYNTQYQAVNLGNPRADSISACAQNAPTFVATSLLPKPTVPGQQSWNVNAPDDILANQNFLSATQVIGVDTVMGSLRNASLDIRNNIPNPINIVSPFNNTSILPDLQRRPLDTYIPDSGLYAANYN